MSQHPEAIQRAQSQVAAALANRGVPARRAADLAESYTYHSSDTAEGPVIVFVPIEGETERRPVAANEFGAMADRIAGAVAREARDKAALEAVESHRAQAAGYLGTPSGLQTRGRPLGADPRDAF